MSIFTSTFKGSIQSQLRTRQEAIFERTPAAIQYYNSRNAWIRMSSAVNVGGSNSSANKHILLGGTLYNAKVQLPFSNSTVTIPQLRSGVGKGNEAYSTVSQGGKDHRLGIRPMPGIVSLDVKSKSAYGSLREATVNFQCWDIRQLEELEKLYMRPGYTVLVEWGWVPYLDNNKNLVTTPPNFIDIVNNNYNKGTVLSTGFNRSLSHGGNYDSCYGKVQNFNWSARTDGGYDCTTTIITYGEIMESLKVNYGPYTSKVSTTGLFNAPWPTRTEDFQKQGHVNKSYSQNIIAGICDELYHAVHYLYDGEDAPDPLPSDPGLKEVVVDGVRKVVNAIGEAIVGAVTGDEAKAKASLRGNRTLLGYNFYRFDLAVQNPRNPSNTIMGGSANIYILLRDFIDILNKYVLIEDTKSKSPLVKVSVDGAKHMDNEGPLLCTGDIFQLSTDPTVCLIKNPAWASPETAPLNITFGTTGENNTIVTTEDLDTYKKLMTDLQYKFWEDNKDGELGIIGNIYVNLDYIYSLATNDNLASQDKKEKNDVPLVPFLKNIMNGINTAIGNVANFDIFIDPIDDVARIIDVSSTEPKKVTPFTFELQNTKSIVRNYKLESKIFPEQSTIVAIGAQVEGGAIGEDTNTLIDFNSGLTDRVIPEKKSPSTTKTPDGDKEKLDNLLDNLGTIFTYLSETKAGFFELVGDFNASEGAKYSNALKDIINFHKSLVKDKATRNKSIIPTKLSLEIDGIGGMVIGNLFRIPGDLLPEGYKSSKMAYTVTGLSHRIQNNDWVTTIESQIILLDNIAGGGLPKEKAKDSKGKGVDQASSTEKPTEAPPNQEDPQKKGTGDTSAATGDYRIPTPYCKTNPANPLLAAAKGEHQKVLNNDPTKFDTRDVFENGRRVTTGNKKAGGRGGGLGCAVAVSIVFLRATGYQITNKRDIINACATIKKFFDENGALWQKREKWQDAQPGDVVVTAGQGGTSGHIGIVSDEIAKNGTYVIYSNTSGPYRGTAKSSIPAGEWVPNYSVKGWNEVATRCNGNVCVKGTGAYHYIGPCGEGGKGKIPTQTSPPTNNNSVSNVVYNAETFKSWADQMQEAFDGCDTFSKDYSITSKIFSLLRNNSDFEQLFSAYGTRTHDKCGVFTGDFKGNLTQAIAEELDSSERAKLNSVLTNKKIKYRV